MLAICQSSGISPDDNDSLKMNVRIVDISSPDSLRMQGGTSSGPTDFCESRLCSSFSTPKVVTSMLGIGEWLLVGLGNGLALICVNVEAKYAFRQAAFDLSSETMPLSVLREDILVDS